MSSLDLVIPTHSTDGSIENEVIKIESCPVTEDAEQKLRGTFFLHYGLNGRALFQTIDFRVVFFNKPSSHFMY